jgi:hypothetical protein
MKMWGSLSSLWCGWWWHKPTWYAGTCPWRHSPGVNSPILLNPTLDRVR